MGNAVWANDYQNINEHWDVAGTVNNGYGLQNKITNWPILYAQALLPDTLKFDIKGMKKKNRWDAKTQDKCAWIEGTNVQGKPGWIKGQANYIVFEREDCWLTVNRQELLDFVQEKLKKNSYATGKKPYHIYQRSDWGRKDKITLVPFKDIETLKDIRRLEK